MLFNCVELSASNIAFLVVVPLCHIDPNYVTRPPPGKFLVPHELTREGGLALPAANAYAAALLWLSAALRWDLGKTNPSSAFRRPSAFLLQAFGD